MTGVESAVSESVVRGEAGSFASGERARRTAGSSGPDHPPYPPLCKGGIGECLRKHFSPLAKGGFGGVGQGMNTRPGRRGDQGVGRASPRTQMKGGFRGGGQGMDTRPGVAEDGWFVWPLTTPPTPPLQGGEV